MAVRSRRKIKERNLEISSVQNPIAVWVEDNKKASTLVLTFVSKNLKLLYHSGGSMGRLSKSQLKALDELLFDYCSIDHKIAVRKLEIEDIPNTDINQGGGRANTISKPTELTVERWDKDIRLNSLYNQKNAVESTLEVLDDDLTKIFWLRWSRGSVNTWEAIAYKMSYDRSTIYRKRERILEIFANFYGFC